MQSRLCSQRSHAILSQQASACSTSGRVLPSLTLGPSPRSAHALHHSRQASAAQSFSLGRRACIARVANETDTEREAGRAQQSQAQQRSSTTSRGDEGFNWNDFTRSDLPQKLGVLLGLIALSRVGVYIRLPGVDVDGFAAMMQNSGLLGYVDTLSGGSISKVGLFSLGIIPYINASIVLQLLSAAFPSLKKMQREDGAQGRARFTYYQKLAAFAFAIVQVSGLRAAPRRAQPHTQHRPARTLAAAQTRPSLSTVPGAGYRLGAWRLAQTEQAAFADPVRPPQRHLF